ncbi:hypothetical protein MESS4_p20010 [Mesorhizobium sp. STM 4661]|nr:hypothetical protein MESS4_p20010 [Mesorhizobium sp. STM 4661]
MAILHRSISITFMNRSRTRDSYFELDRARKRFDVAAMERDGCDREFRLSVLRLQQRPTDDEAYVLLVFPIMLGAMGSIGDSDADNAGEPLESWLGRRFGKSGAGLLQAGR